MILPKPLILIVSLLVGLLITTPVFAAQPDPFDLMIVPTVDQQLDSWLKTPPDLKPTIHMPDKLYPYQPFDLRALFRGYTLSETNNADITYDVQFYDPAGKPTADHGEKLLGYNGLINNKNAIITNQQLLRVFFDESYPFGEYKIEISAKDHVANKIITRSDTIKFAPFEQIAKFASSDFYNFWIRNYFRQPDVVKALFGYLQYFDDTPEWFESNMHLTGFTRRLLIDNPWLWQHLVPLYQRDPDRQEKIIALMALSNHLVPEIAATFSAKQKNTYDQLQEIQKPRTKTETEYRDQIAFLWGDFYATGHLEPLVKIVRYLKPFALSEAPEKNFESLEPEQVAFWTLVDNGKEIPLVSIFCTYLIDHGKLAPENTIQLRLALEVIAKALEDQNKENSGANKKNAPTSTEIGGPLRN